MNPCLPPSDAFPHSTASNAATDPVPARSAQRADGRGAGDSAVPFNKMGQKSVVETTVLGDETSSPPESDALDQRGFELDAEWVELLTNGRKAFVLRTPLPLKDGNTGAALVDWLAFTVRPPENEEHPWVVRELQRLGLVGTVETMTGGYAGYTHKAKYDSDGMRLCLIAWGGRHQAATVYVSLPGHGCARVTDWAGLRAWLEQHRATITRLDLAYDDFQGERISMRWAVEQYITGGFGAGGRMPGHQLHGDWLLGDEARSGRTLELGSREGGKLARIYEKGKQLGDAESPWVRVEVEWHNESRRIPYEALTGAREVAGGGLCVLALPRSRAVTHSDGTAFSQGEF